MTIPPLPAGLSTEQMTEVQLVIDANIAAENEACAQAIQLEAMAISPGGEPTAEQWELIHFADRLVDAIRARANREKNR